MMLIPLPYRILAVVLFALAMAGGGFSLGHSWASNAVAVERAKEAEAARKALDAQIARGNALSDQLAKAEAHVVVKTVEVIKHVPSVTTGRRCLEPAAVRLLQPGANPAGSETARPPVAESPAAFAASDRDVAYWIAGANQQYDTCALRLNALVAWHQSTAEFTAELGETGGNAGGYRNATH